MGEMLLNGRLYGASGIRELTQAQYDALPDSKLTDGILYCIKDAGIVEGDQYAPVIYSLEEREIGTWTDGKPLYQKTVYFAKSDLQSGYEIQYNHNISNIDKICSISYIVTRLDNLFVYQAIVPQSIDLSSSYVRGNWTFSILGADATKVRISIGTETYGHATAGLTGVYITFQYTKTTDIPGSGTWGTDGVPMVHYDGNEKIIGTWFGETLYEKSYIITNPLTLASNTWTDTEFSDTGIDVITSCIAGYSTHGTVFNFMSASKRNSKITLFHPRSSQIDITWFTIKYTKTS